MPAVLALGNGLNTCGGVVLYAVHQLGNRITLHLANMLILQDIFQAIGFLDFRVQPVFIGRRLEDNRHSGVDSLQGFAGRRRQDGAGQINRVIGGFFALPGFPEPGKREWGF